MEEVSIAEEAVCKQWVALDQEPSHLHQFMRHRRELCASTRRGARRSPIGLEDAVNYVGEGNHLSQWEWVQIVDV